MQLQSLRITPDKIQSRSCPESPDYVQVQALWHVPSLYGKESDLIEVRGAPNYSIDDVVTDKKADEKKVEEQKSVEDDYRSEDDGEDEEITKHETPEESNDENDSNKESDNSGDDSNLESYSLDCNILEQH